MIAFYILMIWVFWGGGGHYWSMLMSSVIGLALSIKLMTEYGVYY